MRLVLGLGDLKTGNRERRIEKGEKRKKPSLKILLQASNALKSDYQKDAELTAFSDLDGEDFLTQE